jgi:hypothetical protein
MAGCVSRCYLARFDPTEPPCALSKTLPLVGRRMRARDVDLLTERIVIPARRETLQSRLDWRLREREARKNSGLPPMARASVTNGWRTNPQVGTSFDRDGRFLFQTDPVDWVCALFAPSIAKQPSSAYKCFSRRARYLFCVRQSCGAFPSLLARRSYAQRVTKTAICLACFVISAPWSQVTRSQIATRRWYRLWNAAMKECLVAMHPFHWF